MKALVVDDSAAMRKVLSGVLKRCGIHEVQHATDGQQAVEMTDADDFALVVMSWDLPIMSGIDAMRTLRTQAKAMPILMIVNETQRQRALDALKSGATAFLVKPFEPATAMVKVKAALDMTPAGSPKA